MKKTNQIIQSVLEKINPTKAEMKIIDDLLRKFVDKLKNKIKKLNFDAEVFIGGSFAKKTMIKKEHYDVDIFVRFDRKYKNEEISEMAEKLIDKTECVKIIHGSRDYFSVKINDSLFFEIIPVMKVKNPKNAENITDLSYSHVRYVNKKIKSGKILDDIKIAKAFCYATHCYGAESHISGFSGYGLELLVYYYGSFLKFVKAVSDANEKIVIDIEKLHKNKNEIMMNLNSSKLQSPIILVDPTYKQRNVLAALSEETFRKFQSECKAFLKNPSEKLFETRKIDLEKIKKDAMKKKQEFILIEAKTEKPEGDVAGSKLLKFYRHIESEILKFFIIRKRGFNYSGKNSARYFFVVESRKEILIIGPDVKDIKNSENFKKRHKNYFTKNGKLYSKEKINFGIKEFIDKWKKKNKEKIKSMSIERLKIIKD